MSRATIDGLRYAFGRGLDPRMKDGVRAHPGVLAAGLILHAGVAAAIAALIVGIAGIQPSRLVALVLALLAVAGAAAGVALLARRLREPVLKAISVADDYVSNLLVVLFLLAAASSLVLAAFRPWLLLAGAVLALYAPFGKIRHCVLFFVTRARLGAFLGARGLATRRSHR